MDDTDSTTGGRTDDGRTTETGGGRTTETGVVAFVGATGGAGTTRCALEVAAALAADGADVALFDAAFATQGLADHVSGRIDPDLTALLTDEADAPLSEGAVSLDLSTPGDVAAFPAFAPFERFARAKTAAAAQHLEARLSTAAERYDHVLVDAPPLAANQSLAAVNAAERVVLVAPGTTRGADGVQRMRTRVTHVGGETDVVVSTRGTFEAADYELPASEETDPGSVPSCLAEGGAFARAVVDVVEATVGRDVSGSFEDGGFLADVSRYVR